MIPVFDLGAGSVLYQPHLLDWTFEHAPDRGEAGCREHPDRGRHYFVQAGYDWAIKGDKKYVLQPSTLIKSDGRIHPGRPERHFLYNNQVWLGVTYRTEDAIAPMIGYQSNPTRSRCSEDRLQLRCDHSRLEELQQRQPRDHVELLCPVGEEAGPADLQERTIPLSDRNQVTQLPYSALSLVLLTRTPMDGVPARKSERHKRKNMERPIVYLCRHRLAG
jgi:hypothetical protein